ncbi:MAG: sensor histidine kinase [Cyclonatronaceae bacterium]
MYSIFLVFAAVLSLSGTFQGMGVPPVITIQDSLLEHSPEVTLFDRQGWFYHPGDEPALAADSTFSGSWTPVALGMMPGQVPDGWDGIGWFAGVIRIDSTLYNREVGLMGRIYGAMEVYVNGKAAGTAGRVGTDAESEETIGLFYPVKFSFGETDDHFIAIRYSNHNYRKAWGKAPVGPLLRLGSPDAVLDGYYSRIDATRGNRQISIFLVGVLLAFVFLHLLLFIYYPPEKANLVYSLLLLSYLMLTYATVAIGLTLNPDLFLRHLFIEGFAVVLVAVINIYFVFTVTHRRINWIPVAFTLTGMVYFYFVVTNPIPTRSFLVLFSYLSTITAIIFFSIDRIAGKQRDFNVIIVTYILYFIAVIPRTLLISTDISILWAEYGFVTQIGFIFIPAGYSIYLAKNFALLSRRLKHQMEENEKLAAEKQKLAEQRKEELEREVKARTADLNRSYELLKDSMEKLTAAQDQLIQQEKLASLGQLTAGIAHEIKNPLNFVNNFSEVSTELIAELIEALNSGDVAESLLLSKDIEANLSKIHQHGSRADGIVKAMLMHSRGGEGKMEPANLNALVKEYVNLAFHGMRAGKEPIDVAIDLQLDESIGEIPLIAEDFSRVILNLCNNAFDAFAQRGSFESLPQSGSPRRVPPHKPRLTIRTGSDNGRITIQIEDNGPGIPDDIRDKILQPFFTTKKGTQGTGLGLSITNDIIKAHGGELNIASEQGVGSVFTITLPLK